MQFLSGLSIKTNKAYIYCFYTRKFSNNFIPVSQLMSISIVYCNIDFGQVYKTIDRQSLSDILMSFICSYFRFHDFSIDLLYL